MDGFEFLQSAFDNAGTVASAFFTQQTEADAARAAQARYDQQVQFQYAREDAGRSFQQQLTGKTWGYVVVGVVALAVAAIVLMKKGR